MHLPDLLNCENEPIRIPGKIQSHGFLIAMEPSGRIAFCSENIHEFLPANAENFLNQSISKLDEYFQEKDRTDFFSNLIQEVLNSDDGKFRNPYLLQVNGQFFYLILSRSDDFFLLEFESAEPVESADLHSLMGHALSAILAKTQLSDFLSISTKQIRKIIGYDRVMIYKFHEDGHGEVVAEDKEENLSPFLGLHYPATDIPKQARELYTTNLVRLIADVHQKPAGLITDIDSLRAPLDLTNSVLRAVSPVHIQYLKNMKVSSSFSISLIDQGKLWGLIACHHYSPLSIDYKKREVASIVGGVISSTLGYQQQEEDLHKKHRLQVAVEKLAKQLNRESNIYEALFGQDITVMDAVDSRGAVLVMDKKMYTCGKIPDKEFLEELVTWLNENLEDQYFVSNSFPLEFLPAQSQKEFCSGILALRLSKELNDYLIWMRPEVIVDVAWAGNPNKPVEFDADQKLTLSPRKSFEKWTQTVLNTSEDWTIEDIHSALHLREEVTSSMIRKTAEILKINEKLNEAYKTLDAFSYTISHDLKTPLTIISAYGQMLKEDYGSDPMAASQIDGILSGTKKMNLMISRILHYSKIGQSEVQPLKINMRKLLEDIRKDILFINDHSSTQIIIENTPDIFADETMTMQVFSNLMTNAVKYSSKVTDPIIIINGKDMGTHVKYSISDNGIGIKEVDKEKIFDLFNRSGEVAEYEGSGIGLSIVKRIVEKHGGSVQVESDGVSGSTFYVDFQKQ